MPILQPRPMPHLSESSGSKLQPEQLMTEGGKRFIRKVILGQLKRYGIEWDEQRVDDAVQEAWYKAHRDLDKFHQGTNFEAWMTTLVSRIVIDELRKDKTRAKKGTLARDEDHERIIENRSAEGGGQEDWEARQSIEQRMARLSNEEREVVELAHLKDLTSEQIADRLGRTVRRVQGLLRSAREKMMRDEDEEREEAA